MATKKINEKTSGISLAGFQPRTAVTPAPVPAALVDRQPSSSPDPVAEPSPAKVASKSFTGAGIFMSAITGKDEISKELADVQSKLDEAIQVAKKFEGADLVMSLETRLVRRSQWANRNPAEFLSPEFQALKEEIGNAGGNTQPIKVRRIEVVVDGQPEFFEIVFGHRRFQACVEESLKVNAVIVDHMTDLELFEAMERENRGRKNLSAWEQGMMYQDALKKGLYPSARKLEEALNLNHSDCTRALQLAKLPKAVVNAFATPLDLQVRWSKYLTDAMQKDPDIVLSRAATLSKMNPRPSASDVFKELVEGGVFDAKRKDAESLTIKGEGGKSGKIGFNQKKKTFEISLTGLDQSKMKAVEATIRTLIS